jgi:hypothetical protein
MDDAVLPNDGNESVALVAGATVIGAPLRDVHGLPTTSEGEIVGTSGLTQFRVLSDDEYEVHGFAAEEDTTAGMAAFQQIDVFLQSSWDGEPRIVVPPLCPEMRCDFGPLRP